MRCLKIESYPRSSILRRIRLRLREFAVSLEGESGRRRLNIMKTSKEKNEIARPSPGTNR